VMSVAAVIDRLRLDAVLDALSKGAA